MTDQPLSDLERAKKRAELKTRAHIREVEGVKAAREYQAAQQAALERIPRLRALRLEREAREKLLKALKKA